MEGRDRGRAGRRRPAAPTGRGECHNRPMRFFNTEGPVRPDDHYAIPPLDRMDVDELLALIRAKRYFVLHAPRQTGKTSALIALRDLLNSGEAGNFRCVHTNVEVGQAARDDTARGMRAILSGWPCARGCYTTTFTRVVARGAGSIRTGRCAGRSAVQLVRGEPCAAGAAGGRDRLAGRRHLLSVLRQLRAGYEQRPEAFPQSVVLCGVRDIRDYRIRSSAGEVIAGGSPFNVAAKSLRMGDFTEAETRTLMAQHTEETGQPFSAAALDAVWTQTQGQPWLVNALCAGACFDNKAGRDRSRTIEALAIPHNMDKSRGARLSGDRLEGAADRSGLRGEAPAQRDGRRDRPGEGRFRDAPPAFAERRMGRLPDVPVLRRQGEPGGRLLPAGAETRPRDRTAHRRQPLPVRRGRRQRQQAGRGRLR